MTQLTFPEEQSAPPDPVLLSEMGWTEVATGLNRILLGNLLLIFMPMFGALLIAVALSSGGDPSALIAGDKTPKGGYEVFLLLLAGVLVIVLSGLIGYPLILFGRIRCLINVPERCGAKWLIFVCVLALIAGPALSVIAGVLGAGRDLAPEKGARKAKVVAAKNVEQALPQLNSELLTKSWFWLNMGSVLLSLTSEVCFLLFLRSVAQCFRSQSHVTMVDFYFLLFGAILVMSLYLLFGGPTWSIALPLGVCVLLGLVGLGVWYLVLLGSISWCITDGMERLRPPSAEAAAYAAAH